MKTLDWFNVPHDDLTAWIFWLLLLLIVLLGIDIVIHLKVLSAWSEYMNR